MSRKISHLEKDRKRESVCMSLFMRVRWRMSERNCVHMCVCVCERERQRETERDRERQRESERDREKLEFEVFLRILRILQQLICC